MRKKLGEVLVDSGQLFITDPCYLEDWTHGDIVDNKEKNTFVYDEQTNDYGRVCALTVGEQGYGEHSGGLAFANFGGDGSFPVYGNYEGNRLVSIEIVFEEEEEEYPEDEEETYDDPDKYCDNCGTWAPDRDDSGFCDSCVRL
jgi:hypothetical protein